MGLFGTRPGLPPGDTTGSDRCMDLVARLMAYRLMVDVTRIDERLHAAYGGACAAAAQRASGGEAEAFFLIPPVPSSNKPIF